MLHNNLLQLIKKITYKEKKIFILTGQNSE